MKQARIVCVTPFSPMNRTTGDSRRASEQIRLVSSVLGKEPAARLEIHYSGLSEAVESDAGVLYHQHAIPAFRWWETSSALPFKSLAAMLFETWLAAASLKDLSSTSVILSFGSTSIVPLLARVKGFRGPIVHDLLGNHLEWLVSDLANKKRLRKLATMLRVGIFMPVHFAQLVASNFVIFSSPDETDITLKLLPKYRPKVAWNPTPVQRPFESLSGMLDLRLTGRTNLRLPHEAIVFLFLAGLPATANIEALDTLLRAWRGLKCSNAYLVIAGPWKGHVKQSGDQERLLLAGIVPGHRVPELLAAADFGLAPLFRVSGVPVKVVEYLSAGLKVITSKSVADRVRTSVESQADRFAEVEAPQDLPGTLQRLADSFEADLDSRFKCVLSFVVRPNERYLQILDGLRQVIGSGT